MMNQSQMITCPICGDSNPNLWSRQQEISLYRCPQCRLVYVPGLTAEDLNAELYGKRLQNPSHSESGSLKRKQVRWKRDVLKPLEAFRQTGNLLEIGFGRGEFLGVAHEMGWNVQGIDVAQELVDSVREHYGFQVQKGTLEEVDLPQDDFDIIYLSELIEHIPEPLSFMQKVARLLHPGGIVVLRTPNIDSWVASFAGDRWEKVDIAFTGHVSLFCPYSIRYLCRKTGLKVLKMKTVGFTIRGLYQDRSKMAYRLARILEKLPRPFALWFGKGSTLHLWAKRPILEDAGNREE